MAVEVLLRDRVAGRYHLGSRVDGNEFTLRCDAVLTRVEVCHALPMDVKHGVLCRTCFNLPEPVASRGR